MLQRIDSLRDWIDYKNIEKDFAEMTLHDLFARLVRLQVNPSQLPMVVRKSLLQDWVDWLLAKEPVLGQFRCTQHEQLVEEFRDLDRMHWRLGPHRVTIDAARFRPPVTTYSESEAYVLAREALKKRRHLPLRKLFPLISNLLLRIKPCLLMSPLSVSQFLDPKLFTFDLVIFDEASQVRTEDSIGAIYRGRQIVVCGDDKQLPPTSFFEEILSDEFYEHGEETFDEYESILQACAVAGMRQQMLLWHYRSRHESLIAFSNHQFYGDKLVTFPSAVEESQELGVKFIHVPDGVYDRGGKRDNKREAEKVLELVKAHFRECPTKSLGVVSFSISQANTIEDYVEQMRRDHPEFEPFFVENRLEGFFVKNLENVQGDERDVLIFSVGYGRDQHGRLTMNFGPLNREGGQRRLNVAITRAREKVYLVSSIKAEDFDLSDARAPGVLQLYKYLQYAEVGPQALELSIPSYSEHESPLEAEVAKEIRNFGYDAKAQVGCSGYRIDLGVIDPEKPGKFILGVECDGATYHSAYTARDRDRIRQEVLEKLGWRIHRVWAPDFVTRRDTEVRRLKEAIELARSPLHRSNQHTSEEKDEGPQPEIAPVRTTPIDQNAGWATFYEAHVPVFRPPWNLQFHDYRASGNHKKLLKQIVDKEGPLHVDIAARRLAQAWELQRIGNRMSQAIDNAIRSLVGSSDAVKRADFLWPNSGGFQLRVRKPKPDDPRTMRSIRYIPPEEIELAFIKILGEALSMPGDALITQVGKLFGLDRLASESQNLLDQIMRKLTSEGSIIEKEGRLSIALPRHQVP
jgi:very-short-patch-repair endonuclease